MRIHKHLLVFVLPCLLLVNMASAQDEQRTLSGFEKLSNQYLAATTKSSDLLAKKLERSRKKILQRFDKYEQKCIEKLKKIDSAAAQTYVTSKASELIDGNGSTALGTLPHPTDSTKGYTYNGRIDTLKTTVQYLVNTTNQQEKVQKALSSLQSVQKKFTAANITGLQLEKNKQELATLLKQHGLQNYIKALDKEVYYYQQQLNEYKALLKDGKKMEQKFLAMLHTIPSFNNFLKQNSELARLFNIPGNNTVSGALGTNVAGLQTRSQVQQLLQNQLGIPNNPGVMGNNPQQFLQQPLQGAVEEINQLKKQAHQFLDGAEGNASMPNFKPNTEKNKRLLQRIEWGMNIQSTKNNILLPATTDIAINIGYKLNSKSVIGVGVGYKMGWGKPFKDIAITHEGISLRSFLDYKILKRNSIWITGGYEQNFMQRFSQLPQLANYSQWQQSGLLGLTKKYKIGRKMGNVQLLWDFLSYQQRSPTQEFIFRTGLNF